MTYDSQIIDSVFSAHGIAAGVADAFQTATQTWYTIGRSAAQRIDPILNLVKELDDTLTRAHGKDCMVRFDSRPLRMSVPRQDAQPLLLASLLAQWARKGTQFADNRLLTVLGEAVTTAIKPYAIDLSGSSNPHVFVAGTTGSGKTNAIAQMVLSTCYLYSPAQLQLVMVDPKGFDRNGVALPELDALPQLVTPTVTEPEKAVEALRWAVAEMDRRKAEADYYAPRLLVVVDELADLMAVAGAEVEAALTRILQVGRGTGVHVIAATQKPTSAIVGSLVKANFPARYVGKVTGKVDANVAADMPGCGAERSAGRGDFVLVRSGEFTRIQAYFVPKADGPQFAQAIRDRWQGVKPAARQMSLPQAEPSQNVQAEPMPGALLSVFEEYAQSDGTLARGGLARAIAAISPDNPPAGGPPYYAAKTKVENHLLTYLQSDS